MSMRATSAFVTVLCSTLFANTAAAHYDPETANSILHGVQHLVIWQNYLLMVLGAGLVVAVARSRTALRQRSRKRAAARRRI